ncbi:MAG: hypothetical protein ACXU8R_27680 [Xanthobacteraceae bacterium]
MASKLSPPTRRDVVLAGSSLLVMAPQVARGQAAEPVRFSLEFRIYGGNAPLFHSHITTVGGRRHRLRRWPHLKPGLM